MALEPIITIGEGDRVAKAPAPNLPAEPTPTEPTLDDTVKPAPDLPTEVNCSAWAPSTGTYKCPENYVYVAPTTTKPVGTGVISSPATKRALLVDAKAAAEEEEAARVPVATAQRTCDLSKVANVEACAYTCCDQLPTCTIAACTAALPVLKESVQQKAVATPADTTIRKLLAARKIGGVGATRCAALVCTAEECCEALPAGGQTCQAPGGGDYACPASMSALPKGEGTCATDPCVDNECCVQKVSCSSVTCPAPLVAKASATRQCTQWPCLVTDCCEAVSSTGVTCEAYTCGQGYHAPLFNGRIIIEDAIPADEGGPLPAPGTVTDSPPTKGGSTVDTNPNVIGGGLIITKPVFFEPVIKLGTTTKIKSGTTFIGSRRLLTAAEDEACCVANEKCAMFEGCAVGFAAKRADATVCSGTKCNTADCCIVTEQTTCDAYACGVYSTKVTTWTLKPAAVSVNCKAMCTPLECCDLSASASTDGTETPEANTAGLEQAGGTDWAIMAVIIVAALAAAAVAVGLVVKKRRGGRTKAFAASGAMRSSVGMTGMQSPHGGHV